MRKRELQEYYKVMFTEYPDVVNVEQLCEMLGGPSSKSVYRLLKEVSDWPPKIRFVGSRTFVIGTGGWYPVRVNGR